MSKLKITIERKEEQKQGCKHEVGGVYLFMGGYYLLVKINNSFVYIKLEHCEVTYNPNLAFESLEAIDKQNHNDIPVDAELIIREVQ